ncbi:hypothetical protein H6P81_006445 [Aristolochia fimbriata]|uniref:Uncharacterized protein n=1 Tax=Aristolochia fimbriata TaxID=158543 RepID=A0AAV7F115_ARIFI|nr:hypothetical protein H6P81_006445 [Aristolochia fimbriata]
MGTDNSPINQFKQTHFSRKRAWGAGAEEKYAKEQATQQETPLNEKQIVEDVLGSRSGYIKGQGQTQPAVPKRPRGASSSFSSIQNVIDQEDTVGDEKSQQAVVRLRLYQRPQNQPYPHRQWIRSQHSAYPHNEECRSLRERSLSKFSSHPRLQPGGPENTRHGKSQAAHWRHGSRNSFSSHRLQDILQPALGSTVAYSNEVVPSTLHQCFKYWENGEQKTVYVDESPFTEVEASFVDAKFYLTTRPTVKLSLWSNQAANVKSTPTQPTSSKQPTQVATLKQPSQATKSPMPKQVASPKQTTTQVVPPKQPAHNRQSAYGHKSAAAAPKPVQHGVPILRYIPQWQRKKGEAPLDVCHKIQPTPLPENVMLPLPKL